MSHVQKNKTQKGSKKKGVTTNSQIKQSILNLPKFFLPENKSPPCSNQSSNNKNENENDKGHDNENEKDNIEDQKKKLEKQLQLLSKEYLLLENKAKKLDKENKKLKKQKTENQEHKNFNDNSKIRENEEENFKLAINSYKKQVSNLIDNQKVLENKLKEC
ncbi:hypothetical protein M0812_12401 [Anaeramoeba flamelloides]|uniref:Uncharacterized protein n=1 Tax=Anaeramoeba flamelloides TaxID=1746091 RepID=A0AAV7ZPD3_9EUKA|nr:hypothetical protein M0812_12401 [Anaeramoeba flamelloides]